MKILFLSKDPKKCAEMHRDEEVINKIPQYTRLLCKSLNFQIKPSKHDKYCDTIEWLTQNKSHRHYIFNLIRQLLHEYDKRFGANAFAMERLIIEEISFWGKMDKIVWPVNTF